MQVKLNNKVYHVKDTEFLQLPHNEYNNLIIRDNLGYLERIIGLIKDLHAIGYNDCILYNQDHGGFVPINCSNTFDSIFLLKTEEISQHHIYRNLSQHSIGNIFWQINKQLHNFIIYSEKSEEINLDFINNYEPILLTTRDPIISSLNKFHDYSLSQSNLSLYIPLSIHELFIKHFYYYIDEQTNILNYDNLIHLCIMVKNGGELFEEMLQRNMSIIDRWTILDTGSTDGTIDVINKLLVGKKKGTLYQEPFINFRDSRNRCLDLAGTTCKYNVMLDDTYCLEGDLRSFLTEIRGDQFGNSYSLTVKSHDVEYISNRITKSEDGLRYIYTMHEVIQDKNNTNVRVPQNRVFIKDQTNKYMMERSEQRKEYDLKCLFEMLEEYPDEPRHLFYLAQTYKMLKQYEKAAEYYYKRAFFRIDGFEQEKFDALFEFTRINIYELGKPWTEFKKYYELCTVWQPTRPEGNYFLGIHYYMDGDRATAFDHFKKAYQIGFPSHQQYSLKPTINNLFTPYYLSLLCYEFNDYQLGLDACSLYLQSNGPSEMYYSLMTDWYKIYSLLVQLPTPVLIPKVFDKPILCIVADGGFTPWSGSSIVTTGVGGSETWAIEMARYMSKHSNYEVIVFCNCEKEEIFEEVKYIHLSRYLETVSTIRIEHCIISRFSEYIPVTIHSHVQNIYVILHDLQLSGNIIPIHTKLKNIFCLSEWHCKHFLETFPQFTSITKPLHYGIDFNNFLSYTTNKIPYSFIYSSFPNRGLIVLLKMWPQIIAKYPQAILHIFTDVTNNWANTHYKEEMEEIVSILDNYKQIYSTSVFNHGWVSKKVLSDYWKQSAIWFYPCKFKETFCLTALEAALTKTLAITNDLAALEDTVGPRGICIPGDVLTNDWQQAAFLQICNALDNPAFTDQLIEQNFHWALHHSWENQALFLLNNYINFDTVIVQDTENITLNITEKSDPKIDQLYYINLDARTDRNQHFLNEMDKHKIPLNIVNRFEAINGLYYPFSADEQKLFERVDYLHMPTKLKIMGNQLSHFNILQEIIKFGYKYVLVCQDDIVFKDGFKEYINLLVHHLPEDAEIVHFGFHKYAVRDVFLPFDLLNDDKNANNDLQYEAVNEYICRLYPEFKATFNSNNTTGYLVTLKGAQNYVEHVLKNGFRYATDCDLDLYLINKNIYYGTTTVLATTNPIFGSDVFENIYNPTQSDSSNPFKLTINNHFLNYADHYNWTNDLPSNTNAKLKFVTMLSNFIKYKTCNVLEIGTFVGTSVIGILQYLPQATAVALDNFDTTSEEICHDNINKSGLKDRICVLKGEPYFLLVDLLKENKLFDFVYINHTNTSANTSSINDWYTYCLLSWKLLNVNGILCVDRIEETVSYFLQKIKDQYIILEKADRIFIRKM